MLHETLSAMNPRETPTTESAVRIMSIVGNLNERFTEELGKLLKEENLSPLQYQVLRMVGDAGEQGLPSLSIKQLVPYRVMDVTRLVDRLETADFVTRYRPPHDRRVVLVRVSQKGRATLERLDGPFKALNVNILNSLNPEQVEALEDILGHLE